MDIREVIAHLLGRRVSDDSGAYVEACDREIVRFVAPDGRVATLDLLFGKGGERIAFEHDLVSWSGPTVGTPINHEERQLILKLVDRFCNRHGQTLTVRAG